MGNVMATSRTMRQLARQRLDKRARALRELPSAAKAPPRGGWIRAIREALGMPRRVLGELLGVGEKRVEQMEAGEARGKISVDSLQKAAAALDCELVIALVPRTPLEERVRRRRMELAREWIRTRMLHTMSLEDQRVACSDLPPSAIEEVERMFPDERLWEKP